MAIVNGVIVGARNTANEGRTPNDVMIGEANRLCRVLNELHNTHGSRLARMVSDQSSTSEERGALMRDSAEILDLAGCYLQCAPIMDSLADCELDVDAPSFDTFMGTLYKLPADVDTAIANVRNTVALIRHLDGPVASGVIGLQSAFSQLLTMLNAARTVARQI